MRLNAPLSFTAARIALHTLARDFSLNVKSQTVLFSDLKGSTALYEKWGDFAAYRLVQKHFDILAKIVRRHSGAIVKSMGDAIMAAFSDPLDGMLAALDMINEIEEM